MAPSACPDHRPAPAGDWAGAGNPPDPALVPRELESRTVFGPWRTKGPGMVRDLDGASRVLDALLDGRPRLPSVLVTGSKGKGQAATTAAAGLSAAGLRTGLVTSPGLVSNLDRFCLDGAVVGARTYAAGLERLRRILAEHQSPAGTYLSPTGLFTVLGHALLARAGAEVVVHEAGMGGAGDEISVLESLAVGLSRIFPEHLDVFGPTLEHVAREKIGLVRTAAPVVSLPQEPDVADLLRERCEAVGASLHVVGRGPFPAQNRELGELLAREAARRWTESAPGHRPLDLDAGPTEVHRPGRSQLLQAPSGHPLVVDAAIDVVGLRQALSECRSRWGTLPQVLWSVPMTKNFRALSEELDRQGADHAFVVLESGHLDYRLPSDWARGPRMLALEEALDAVDRPTLVVGTISFGSAVLGRLGETVEHLYRPAR